MSMYLTGEDEDGEDKFEFLSRGSMVASLENFTHRDTYPPESASRVLWEKLVEDPADFLVTERYLERTSDEELDYRGVDVGFCRSIEGPVLFYPQSLCISYVLIKAVFVPSFHDINLKYNLFFVLHAPELVYKSLPARLVVGMPSKVGGGGTSRACYFIKLLIEKNYALPSPVFNALVAHFMRFYEDSRVMPAIWHHTRLAFAQRMLSYPKTRFCWSSFVQVLVNVYKSFYNFDPRGASLRDCQAIPWYTAESSITCQSLAEEGTHKISKGYFITENIVEGSQTFTLIAHYGMKGIAFRVEI
ncbi:bystin [Striga asiatica]|uniref:Bystin n=1 Tax=Striga asiatica TaxID=4170 RepID=A0A5A7PZS1_STRAF|nr:bystin [Striga asiatica]